MSKTVIFSYRVSHDTGLAPCITKALISLACCKGGQIRKGKLVYTGLRYHIGEFVNSHKDFDVYIVGIYKNRLLYAAKIEKVITMMEYYANKEYSHRIDSLYAVEDSSLTRRRDYLPSVHSESENQMRDIAGKYVLLSSNFYYAGEKAREIPTELLEMLPKNREYLPKMPYDKQDNRELLAYVNGYLRGEPIIAGKPHDPITGVGCKGCNQR